MAYITRVAVELFQLLLEGMSTKGACTAPAVVRGIFVAIVCYYYEIQSGYRSDPSSI